MHRTYSTPRLSGWAALLTLLTLTGAVHNAAAQGLQPAAFMQAEIQQTSPPLTMAVGATHIYTGKYKLKKVENPNSKVVFVSQVKDDLKSVILQALNPGRTTITVTDEKDNRDVFDIIVISDRVKELRELIKRTIPTGSITVDSTDSGATISLNGYVLTDYDAKVVSQFVGPGIINNVKMGGVQQVQLEVIVAQVDRSSLREMSFSWMQNGSNWFGNSLQGASPWSIGSSIVTGGALSSGLVNPTQGQNVNFGIASPGGRSSFLGFLQALRSDGLTKIITEPRVTTTSGQWGYIVSGGQVPIVLATGVGAPPNVSYKNFGTIVQFKPTVKGNGRVYLQVRAEVSSVDKALGISSTSISAVGFLTQAAQVEVEIDDGQTVAIGGLIQNNVTATITRVPFLGDIPFLGMAFTSKSYKNEEQELVILVTPRLVDPFDCTKFPKYLPGRATRDPDDFELFMEGIIEAPRGPRDVSLRPRYYKPAFQGGPSMGLYPCAGGVGNSGVGCASGSCNVASPSPMQPASYMTPAVTMPAPNFPKMPAQPVPVSNVVLEPALLPPAPVTPGLGPIAPITPTPLPPVREFDNRPSLPPVTPSLLGPR